MNNLPEEELKKINPWDSLPRFNNMWNSIEELLKDNPEIKKNEESHMMPPPPPPSKAATTDILSKNDIDFLFLNLGKKEEEISPTDQTIEESVFAEIQFPDSVLTNPSFKTEQISIKVPEGKTFARKFDIYEGGSFLGMTLGTTNLNDSLKLLENFNQSVVASSANDKVYLCNELSLVLCFNENFILKELTLGEKYKGQTSRGLRIGDKMEDAIRIYGQPEKINGPVLSWGKMLVFFKREAVTHIKIYIL